MAYLTAWVEAIYLDTGRGTGPVSGALTEAERAHVRRAYPEFLAQYERFIQRTQALEAIPADVNIDRLAERTQNTARKLGQLGDELARWAGVDAREILAFAAPTRVRLGEEGRG